MKNTLHTVLLFSICCLLLACEKEVDIQVPVDTPEVVIEGRVENGLPPLVFVSTTRGFFEPTGFDDFAALYRDDAQVRVNGVALERVCSDEIPEELLPFFAEATGIPVDALAQTSLCGYVGFNPSLIGQENTTYRLEVDVLDKNLDAVAHIPYMHAPDSVWFRLWANSPKYGFVFANLSDPDTVNNAYRVFTRRIETANSEYPSDQTFYAPLGAAFADDFFNGETIEVGFTRGQPPNSTRPGDSGEQARFFETGDVFVFKFCNTTRPVYDFFRTFEAQLGSNGSPFAAPNNLITNINGGLGIWAAYACVSDTIFAEE
jgi:hypothetical protein